jgi:hypothetical protein
MAIRYYANAPATTLAASCSNSQTSLVVASVTGFPIQYPYSLIIDRGTASEEVVSVTNASGTTLTVTRAIDSTTAFSHALGAAVEHGISAQDVREPNAHINASTAVHGLAGAVVGTTDTQALSNKDLTAGSNSFPTSLVTLTGTQTLTNKTLGSTNTINGFTASRFMEADGTGKLASGSKTIPTGTVVGTSDTQTLTNKTVALGSNTVSGTTAQFNTALTDNDFATLAGTETLTNKDLSSATNTFPGTTVFRSAAGKVTITFSAATSATQTITFPSSRFTLTPLIFFTGGLPSVSARLGFRFESPTTTGCTVRAYTTDNASITGTVELDWWAVQMTSGSESG